jgi:hypothetical protein
MDVVGDAGSRGFAEVHAQIEAIGVIDLTEAALHLLGGKDHLVGRFWWKGSEGVNVLIGQDQHMAGGVGIGIEADKAERPAMDDVSGSLGCFLRYAVSDGIVGGGDHVAEDAVLIFGGGPSGESGRDAGAGLLVGSGDVVVAPGGPETVHKSEYKVKDRRIPGLSWSQTGGKVIKIVKQVTCCRFSGLVPEFAYGESTLRLRYRCVAGGA